MVAQRVKPTAVRKRTATPTVHFATRREGRMLFDNRVRARLGISGGEFLRRLDSGGYRDVDDATARKVADIQDLIPFVRVVKP